MHRSGNKGDRGQFGVPAVPRGKRRQQVHLLCKVASSVLNILEREGPTVRGTTMTVLASCSEGRWAAPCMFALKFRV